MNKDALFKHVAAMGDKATHDWPTPIPNCPQPETPIRDRAWTDEQRWQMFRRFLATENDIFMNTFYEGLPGHATEAQLDATCDAAINAAIATGATP